MSSMNSGDCPEAIEVRHEQVHEDHVGAERIGALNGYGSILGLADDFEVVLQLEKASQAATDDLVVINYQDLDAS
jgi:hypothetical protein